MARTRWWITELRAVRAALVRLRDARPGTRGQREQLADVAELRKELDVIAGAVARPRIGGGGGVITPPPPSGDLLPLVSGQLPPYGTSWNPSALTVGQSLIDPVSGEEVICVAEGIGGNLYSSGYRNQTPFYGDGRQTLIVPDVGLSRLIDVRPAGTPKVLNDREMGPGTAPFFVDNGATWPIGWQAICASPKASEAGIIYLVDGALRIRRLDATTSPMQWAHVGTPFPKQLASFPTGQFGKWQVSEDADVFCWAWTDNASTRIQVWRASTDTMWTFDAPNDQNEIYMPSVGDPLALGFTVQVFGQPLGACSFTINSPTQVTVTLPSNPLTSAFVGQALQLEDPQSGGGPLVLPWYDANRKRARGVITSVSGNTIVLAVVGWPAGTSGTAQAVGGSEDYLWKPIEGTWETFSPPQQVVHGDVGEAYVGLSGAVSGRFVRAPLSTRTFADVGPTALQMPGGAVHLSDRSVTPREPNRWVAISALGPSFVLTQAGDQLTELTWTLHGGAIWRASPNNWFGQQHLGLAGAYWTDAADDAVLTILPMAPSLAGMTAGSVWYDPSGQGTIYVWAPGGVSPQGRARPILNKPCQDAITLLNPVTGDWRFVAFHGSYEWDFRQSNGSAYAKMPKVQIGPDGRSLLWVTGAGRRQGALKVFYVRLRAGRLP